MKLTKLDVMTAILAGLVCYGLYIKMPVWALFFGWGWFGIVGGGTQAFKKCLPAMALGYAGGGISAFLNTLLGDSIHWIALFVGLTVLVMMVFFKTKTFSCAPVAFGAYSCFFAGYFTGALPPIGLSEVATTGDILGVLLCVGWLALANVIGLCMGLLLENLGKRWNKSKAQ